MKVKDDLVEDIDVTMGHVPECQQISLSHYIWTHLLVMTANGLRWVFLEIHFKIGLRPNTGHAPEIK